MPTKTKRPLRRTRTAKAVTLPTPAAFEALSLHKRTLVFARWLKAQPRRKTYVYMDHSGCALGQFAHALYRNASAIGLANDIGLGWALGRVTVFPRGSDEPNDDRFADALVNNQTFGAASDAFQKALKSRWYRELTKGAA